MPDPTVSDRARALTAALAALAALGGAVWLGWQVNWPAGYALDDPDFFNPFAAMILGLLGIAVWQAVRAVQAERRHRAFGVAVLEMDGPGLLRLGQPFTGRVRVERPVAATGPYRLVLTCHDVHEFDRSDSGPRLQAFPVWSAETNLPATTDATRVLRFRFDLPASVGPEPVPSGIYRPGHHQSRLAVYLPGQRRIAAHNHPPVDRFWTLVITAPTAGVDFRAELPVPLAR